MKFLKKQVLIQSWVIVAVLSTFSLAVSFFYNLGLNQSTERVAIIKDRREFEETVNLSIVESLQFKVDVLNKELSILKDSKAHSDSAQQSLEYRIFIFQKLIDRFNSSRLLEEIDIFAHMDTVLSEYSFAIYEILNPKLHSGFDPDQFLVDTNNGNIIQTTFNAKFNIIDFVNSLKFKSFVMLCYDVNMEQNQPNKDSVKLDFIVNSQKYSLVTMNERSKNQNLLVFQDESGSSNIKHYSGQIPNGLNTYSNFLFHGMLHDNQSINKDTFTRLSAFDFEIGKFSIGPMDEVNLPEKITAPSHIIFYIKE